jgi:hypothetical protein
MMSALSMEMPDIGLRMPNAAQPLVRTFKKRELNSFVRKAQSGTHHDSHIDSRRVDDIRHVVQDPLDQEAACWTPIVRRCHRKALSVAQCQHQHEDEHRPHSRPSTQLQIVALFDERISFRNNNSCNHHVEYCHQRANIGYLFLLLALVDFGDQNEHQHQAQIDCKQHVQ